MDVKEHYDNHLSHFYSWMLDDLKSKQKAFQKFLQEEDLTPRLNQIAIDLGAGNGLQSIPLARLGYKVKAVDFNERLINELAQNAKGFDVEPIQSDIRNFSTFAQPQAELVVCCGDTITHLESEEAIAAFIAGIATALLPKGKLLLSFRDYSNPLQGAERFIPVKSDDSRILTCILDYQEKYLEVTDLLQTKTADGWVQSVSSYRKVRLSVENLIEMLSGNGFDIKYRKVEHGMITLIAQLR